MKIACKSLDTLQQSKILLLITTKLFFVQLLSHDIKYIRSLLFTTFKHKE
jgi:hypothetical protein